MGTSLNIANKDKFNLLKNTMTATEKHLEEKNKILKGLEKVYEKLLEFKKMKKSELVILHENKIVKIKPE